MDLCIESSRGELVAFLEGRRKRGDMTNYSALTNGELCHIIRDDSSGVNGHFNLCDSTLDNFTKEEMIDFLQSVTKNSRSKVDLKFSLLTRTELCTIIKNNPYYFNNIVKYEVKNPDINSPLCGLELDKYYKISSLLCAALSTRNIEDVFDGKQCGNISGKVSKNIIRVASKRIFDNPYRPFVEPIANSIDSYRELANGNISIGKFGMGFFSLFSWLNRPEAYIRVISLYDLGDGNHCNWTASIKSMKKDGDSEEEYYFTLDESEIVSSNQAKTGTTIMVGGIVPGLLQNFDETRLSEELIRSFSRVNDVAIKYLQYGKHFFINELALSKGVKQIGEVTISLDNNHIFGGYNVTIEDNAIGISLDVLFNKLLLPSVSTKTLDKFNEKASFNQLYSSSDIIPSQNYPLNFSTGSSLIITVGDIGIYSINTNEIEQTKRDTRILGKSVKKEHEDDIFILSLPHNSPMPVSRDDLIFDNKEFIKIFEKEIYTITNLIIENGKSLDLFIDLLFKYAEYSGNEVVYRSISNIYEYIENFADIFSIPHGMHSIFKALPIPSNIQFVEMENPRLNKIIHFMKNFLEVYTNIFAGRYVILHPKLKEITGQISTDAGLAGILFVDNHFMTENEDWINSVLKSNYLLLRRYSENDTNIFGDMAESIGTYETVSIGTSRNRSWHGPEAVTTYSNIFGNEVLAHMDVDSTQYADFLYLLYNTMMKISRRSFDHSGRFSMLDLNILDFFGPMRYGEKYYYTRGTLKDKLEKKLNYKLNKSNELKTPSTRENNIYTRLWKNPSNYAIKMNKEQLKYLYDCVTFYYGMISSSNRRSISLRNPFSETILRFYDSGDENKPTSGEILTIFDLFLHEHPAVYYFVGYILSTEYNISFNRSNLLDVVIYLIKEIKSKFALSSLINVFNLDTDIKVFAYMIHSLVISLGVYLRINIDKGFIVKLDDMTNYDQSITFRAHELVDYIYEHDVTMEDVSFITKVPGFVGQKNNKLQSVEIIINEGTSKKYIDSILTELIQNTMDAFRNKIQSENLIRRHDGKLFKVEDGKFSVLDERIDDLDLSPCPFAVDVKVGKTPEGEYVLSLVDYMGIPFRGIISLLIPFLSTKGENNPLNTGEMGSGFWNVYRQPGTKEVRIQTRDPETGHFYKIIGKPHIEKNRVIDVIFSLSISRESYHKQYAMTEISIIFNDLGVAENSIKITDTYIYALKYYSNMHLDVKINGMSLAEKRMLLGESPVGSIYKVVSDMPRPSIIMTNGVPYSELDGYIRKSFEKVPWLGIIGGTDLIVDLSKSTYQPVQSRKKIIMNEEDRIHLDTLIFYGTLYSFYDNILKLGDVPQSMSSHIPGFNYSGQYGQVLPTGRRGKDDTLEDHLFPVEFVKQKLLVKLIETDKMVWPYYPTIMIKSSVKAFGMPSLATVIINISRHVTSLGGDREDIPLMDDVNSYFETPFGSQTRQIVANVARLWYKNKERNTPIEMNEPPKDEEDESFFLISKYVVNFLNDIARSVWTNLYNLVKSGNIGGINIEETPPTIVMGEIERMNGFYSPFEHTITLNIGSMKQSNILKVLRNFYAKVDKSPDDLSEAFKYFRLNSTMNEVAGRKSAATTFIHEFGHALRGLGHDSPDTHGEWNYTMGKMDYTQGFDLGCNDLWFMGFESYKPILQEIPMEEVRRIMVREEIVIKAKREKRRKESMRLKAKRLEHFAQMRS